MGKSNSAYLLQIFTDLVNHGMDRDRASNIAYTLVYGQSNQSNYINIEED